MPGAVSGKTDELVRFIAFYDREYHLVVRFIMNCGAGLTAAEDAAQDAFLMLGSSCRSHESGWMGGSARMDPGVRQEIPASLRTPSATADYRALGYGGYRRSQVDPVDLSVSAMQVMGACQPRTRASGCYGVDLDGFTEQKQSLPRPDDQQVRDRRKKARKILASRLGVMENERRRDR